MRVLLYEERATPNYGLGGRTPCARQRGCHYRHSSSASSAARSSNSRARLHKKRALHNSSHIYCNLVNKSCSIPPIYKTFCGNKLQYFKASSY